MDGPTLPVAVICCGEERVRSGVCNGSDRDDAAAELRTTERTHFYWVRLVILKKGVTELRSTTEPRKPNPVTLARARKRALKTARTASAKHWRIASAKHARQALAIGVQAVREHQALASDNGRDQHGRLRLYDAQGVRFLAKREVLRILGVSAPTVWAWMQRGLFPRSRAMVGQSMWLESEILAWAEALPPSQLKPLKETESA